jgi:enoyl-CoA hydratase
MKYSYLLLNKENGIGTVTVNRPEVMNALNIAVFEELYRMFTEIETDPDIRVVILTGAGKAFVAGVDIREMKDNDSKSIQKFIKIARRAGDAVYNLSKPVIAAVNGYAYGGGNELALACDLIIAAENARFGQQEINLGIVPGGGAIQRLTRLIGMARAKELVYSGEAIDAATALELGYINKVVPAEKLTDEAREWARLLLGKSAVALAYAKKAFQSGAETGLTAGIDIDESYFARCFDTEDQKEGMRAFAERRKPEFKNR